MWSPGKWCSILTACGVKSVVAIEWVEAFAEHVHAGAFSRGEEEIDDFLAHVLHETQMLTRMEENLRYTTPDQLCRTWPRRFPSIEAALPYVRNPRDLANKVYGGRMGNVEPDDGYVFRGSGMLQHTGRANFRAIGKALGVDLEAEPDRLRTDAEVIVRAGVLWWESNVPDAIVNDIEEETLVVNGGKNGLAERERLADVVWKVLS